MNEITGQVTSLAVGTACFPCMEILKAAKANVVNVTQVSSLVQAIKNVGKIPYDVIFLGDRVGKDDIYDVGLELRTGKNRQTMVIFVGNNRTKAAKLSAILGPRFVYSPHDTDAVSACLAKYLGAK